MADRNPGQTAKWYPAGGGREISDFRPEGIGDSILFYLLEGLRDETWVDCFFYQILTRRLALGSGLFGVFQVLEIGSAVDHPWLLIILTIQIRIKRYIINVRSCLLSYLLNTMFTCP
jgi:hypothetical protein